MGTLYRQMSRAQGEAALGEFLAERPTALQRLRGALAGDGIDPDRLLDGSVASLVAVWVWLRARLTGKGPSQPELAGELPSWSRYSQPEESTLSEASILLVDGLISYFGQVVLGQEPQARWRVGFDPRHRNYAYQNEPVLAVDADERGQYERGVELMLSGRARRHLRGQQVPDDEVARLADAVIADLRKALGAGPVAATAIEELIDVSARQQPDEFTHEVAIEDDLIVELPRIVASLAKALAMEPGIEQVWRADREVLHVTAPTWTTDQLHDWAVAHIRKRL
jgi:hypothetical protein